MVGLMFIQPGITSEEVEKVLKELQKPQTYQIEEVQPIHLDNLETLTITFKNPNHKS